MLRRSRELGDAQPGRGDEVGHVRAGATRHRVDAHAGPVRTPARRLVGTRARQRGRGLEQLVEAVDSDHAELPEDRGDDGVGAGEVAGMRLGHGRALVGSSHLHDDHRRALRGGVVGRQHEGAAVLEALDVRGDHADLGLVGEVRGEVGELEVDLVAGRRPVRHRDAELLALEDRAALVPALGDERDRRAGQIGAELGERVQVGVGPEQAGVARGDELGEAGLELLAFGSGLGEAGREDHGEPGAALDDLLERVDRPAGEDHGQVEVAGHLGDRRRGMARPAPPRGWGAPGGTSRRSRRPTP